MSRAKQYYPIHVNLMDKEVLLVGGGNIASERIPVLKECGARITVISPEIHPSIEAIEDITILRRKYDGDDLSPYFLIISATTDPDLHRRIHKEATRLGKLINTVDDVPLCEYITPAVVRRGELVLTACTFGAAPFLTKQIRRDLSRQYPEGYVEWVEWLSYGRKKIYASTEDSKTKLRRLSMLLDPCLKLVIDSRHLETALDRLEEILSS